MTPKVGDLLQWRGDRGMVYRVLRVHHADDKQWKLDIELVWAAKGIAWRVDVGDQFKAYAVWPNSVFVRPEDQLADIILEGVLCEITTGTT